MEIIDILMPTEEGRYIPQSVISGIVRQNIPFRLWISTKFSGGDYSGARNHIKQYGKSDLILMLDNDIVLPPNALSEMIKLLDNHKKLGAIGIPPYPVEQKECLKTYHVSMSCVLFRKDILNRITFIYPGKDGVDHPSGGRCECTACCWDIRQMGFEIGYLPGFQTEHLMGTKMIPALS